MDVNSGNSSVAFIAYRYQSRKRDAVQHKHGKAEACRRALGEAECLSAQTQRIISVLCRCLYEGNGKENGKYYIVYWGYIGVMKKKMETAV